MPDANLLPQTWEARFYVRKKNSKGHLLISTKKYAAMTYDQAIDTALEEFEFLEITVVAMRLIKEEGL